jgi:serine/threonine protein kinase
MELTFVHKKKYKNSLYNLYFVVRGKLIYPIRMTSLHQLQNFHREVTLMSSLKHPYLLSLLAVVQEPYALVLEYMNEGSLFGFDFS